MSLKIRSTKELLNPDTFRLVALVYSLAGTGKTSWTGTLDPETTGVAGCETGNGNGLLPIAEKGFSCCEPENLSELEKFCQGSVFPDKKTLVLDSLSAVVRTIIKDAALKIPRRGGESDKRKMGLPEIDDYGVMGELTRRVLNVLIGANPTKNIIVTALEKYDRPNENDPPGTESLIGPDLPGQMFLGSPALFDFVFRLRTRPKLRDPKDPKSKYNERYLQTQQSQGVIAKCRASLKGVPLLDAEEIVDLSTGQGSIPYLIEKITNGYKQTQEEARTDEAGLRETSGIVYQAR